MRMEYCIQIWPVHQQMLLRVLSLYIFIRTIRQMDLSYDSHNNTCVILECLALGAESLIFSVRTL